jgi:hypothetical protein
MSKERQKYKIAGAATWELIRAAYLGGESAPALAERFGVSEHAIRKRITKEKWTKRDYAAALEARGVAPVARPKPNFIEEGVLREQVRVAAEEADAVKREAETHAWIEQVAAEEEPLAMADALERRALAEASAALVQGRSKDARDLASLAEQMRKHRGARVVAVPPMTPLSVQRGPPAAADANMEQEALSQLRAALSQGRAGDAKTFAGLAEQMRKRAEDDRAAESASEEAEELEQTVVVDAMMEMFGRVAFLAGAMVHEPTSAPAAFLRMIARWRELNLGEGAEDAEAAAAQVAAAQKHYLDGSWAETTPEDVRAYLAARWNEVRKSFG